jgi:hypothetical protein
MQKIAMVGLLVGATAVGAGAGCKGKVTASASSTIGSGAGSAVAPGVGSAPAIGSAAAVGSAAPIAAVDTGPAAATPAAVAQCQRIIDKSRTAIAATFAKHEIIIPDFEKNYAAGSTFGELCSVLAEAKRTCLEAAAQPMAAIATCNVNDGAASNALVQAPSIADNTPTIPLAEGEGAKLLASLVGTWHSEFAGIDTTWTIAADGKVSVNKVEKAGKATTSDYALVFEKVGLIKVRTTPSSTQTYAFFRIDNKTVLLGDNLAYRINPVANVKKFTLKTQGEWIVVDGTACQVVTNRGLETAGTCTWGKTGAVKTFAASWDSGRTIQATGKAIVVSMDYQLLARHLVDQRLLNIATFKKK